MGGMVKFSGSVIEIYKVGVVTKFRILTTDGEWVYSQVNVLEDRIVCPLLNAKGAQFLKPNIKFRPATMGYYVFTWDECHPKKSIRLYEGDILEAVNTTPYIKKGRRYLLMASYGHGITAKPYKDGIYSLNLHHESDYIPLANIHQNPELLEEKT